MAGRAVGAPAGAFGGRRRITRGGGRTFWTTAASAGGVMISIPGSARCLRGVLLVLLAAPGAGAAELIPYAPPPSQSPLQMQRPATQPPPLRAAAVTVPPEVYVQFTAKVRMLSAAQRDELIRRLEHSHDEAVAAGDASREFHYHKLLDILRKGP
jgi:hypothetical protein